ncbi:hypothetical protein UCMB321_4360 [Pseudomonas batumici]|uniref:Uncharacterized protein n=1 Tax=Pseudomonas batumici TaxID=226910 RepID=A0A0C2I9I6_9PSED|nr:hypothetical protein UCMB321_4360 [Pseudomonas batumici]
MSHEATTPNVIGFMAEPSSARLERYYKILVLKKTCPPETYGGEQQGGSGACPRSFQRP